MKDVDKIAELNANLALYAKTLTKIHKAINIQIMRAISTHTKISNQFITLMLSIGWPPVVDLPLHQMELIIKANKLDKSKNTIKKIEKLLIHSYDRNTLLEKLNSWSDNILLKSRINILSEIVQSHIDKKFWVSIPTMCSQIEGIIASGFLHQGKMNSTQLQKYLMKMDVNNYGNIEIYPALCRFINENYLVDFEYQKPIKSDISRHAILHGADTKYGTERNSLRLILCFDFIQAAFQFTGLINRDIIHIGGCPLLYRKKTKNENLIIYNHFSDALNDGRKPCKKCKPNEYL